METTVMQTTTEAAVIESTLNPVQEVVQMTTSVTADTESAVNLSTLISDTTDYCFQTGTIESSDTTVASTGAVTVQINQDTSGLADNTFMPGSTAPVIRNEQTVITAHSPVSVPTEPDYVVELRLAFASAMVNKNFLDERKKVEKATAALTLVDPETRVRAQLETNAYKTLRARAAKVAEDTGDYVAPTLAEVTAYIEAGVKVWRDKQ